MTRVLLLACIVLPLAACQPEGTRTGERAPDFEAWTLDSTTVRLADYRGRYVLLDFWGTWCAPCLQELPYLRAAYDAYPRDQFAILAIANDDPEVLRTFVEHEGIPWTQVIQYEPVDTLRTVLRTYHIDSYPTTFLLDPDGVIVAREAELRSDNLAETLAREIGAR